MGVDITHINVLCR